MSAGYFSRVRLLLGQLASGQCATVPAAWADKAVFCAEALNHLGGFRLQTCKVRGWSDVYKEPLAINPGPQRLRLKPAC
ncbi:hypothetical protein B5M42_015315 [Paenibacillus athensensis]|uniref:Uncharacterized protein n=1 Tax=Paenibacillus athensensis TaxID=1967502 RepID=A0A4Y8Q918_9BACL|nr:hypothetical protein [Paenibacillus athensensis]MCD1260180.1 hypothetical protein [Paenibacillus athensensis]